MKLLFDKVSGRSGLLALEKRPMALYRDIVNWELSEELGNLKKRKPYLTLMSGIEAVYNGIDWTDLNDENGVILETEVAGTRYIRLMNRDGLGYDALAPLDFDDRTSGSTITGTNPIIVNKEVRSGVGISNTTDLPLIAYRLKDQKRYYNPATDNYDATFTNGQYLDDMIYDGKLAELLPPASGPGFLGGPGGKSHVDDKGFPANDVRRIKLYASPVIDGYQRSFPDSDIVGFVADDITTETRYSFTFYMEVFNANKLKSKRITHVDVFASITGEGQENDYEPPYYFLTRIPMDKQQTNHFFEGSMTVTATYVEIDNFAEWFTFENLLRAYVHNVTDDEWIQIDTGAGITTNGTAKRFLIRSGTPTNTGSKKFKMHLGWYKNGSDLRFPFFYDDFHFRLGSEMYDYLGIPKGDHGRDDKRFKYITYNGTRSVITGTPDGGAYYSTYRDPDNFPIRNRVRTKYEPIGIECLREDIIFFSKQNMERMQIYGNDGDVRLDSAYSDRGALSQKAVYKVNDHTIFGCDYKGPWILTNQGFEDISAHLNDYFDPRSGLLTATEKEQCVIGYNKYNDQVWFSFPTYNDGTDYFGNGIIFVYDLRARRLGLTSPWFMVGTGRSITTFVTNEIFHLLGIDRITTSRVQDFNGASGEEEYFAKIEFMTLESPLLNTQINWRAVRGRLTGSDTYTATFYFDGESSPSKSAVLSTTGKGRIFKSGETVRVVLVTGESGNSGTFSGIDLHGNPKVL
jgi:hypothetical protein